jgi:DNA-binding NtrC family response regulator
LPLEKLLTDLKDQWANTPVIGLVCSKESSLHELYPFLANRVDDFLYCPFRECDLIPRIQRFLGHEADSSLSSEIKEIKEKWHLESLIGESPCFVHEIKKVLRLAPSDATVMILGETGTGKELFASAIHKISSRHPKPFFAINCGAMPEHLFENELFGHIKGAYTDAASDQRGILAETEGRTLFLDEIDSLSHAIQTKLLRFLQDREYRPIGSVKNQVADVRILVATNADLKERIQSKHFREDLYYRLNLLSISLPSLRERIEDIPLLAAHILERWQDAASAKKGSGRVPVKLSQGAIKRLMTYPWPGNIRELESVIRRSILLASDPLIRADDIDLPSFGKKSDPTSFCEAKRNAIAQFERVYLVDLLAKHNGNITHAAKKAGKERRSFQRLLQKYGLIRQSFQKDARSN